MSDTEMLDVSLTNAPVANLNEVRTEGNAVGKSGWPVPNAPMAVMWARSCMAVLIHEDGRYPGLVRDREAPLVDVHVHDSDAPVAHLEEAISKLDGMPIAFAMRHLRQAWASTGGRAPLAHLVRPAVARILIHIIPAVPRLHGGLDAAFCESHHQVFALVGEAEVADLQEPVSIFDAHGRPREALLRAVIGSGTMMDAMAVRRTPRPDHRHLFGLNARNRKVMVVGGPDTILANLNELEAENNSTRRPN
mmetsp:Transcript_43808/g.102257  ORF Transcript_43808/g.102257 Transcript_43808/m.102257 type:complete len:249 (-) Transcript_43808:3109-3855(-)